MPCKIVSARTSFAHMGQEAPRQIRGATQPCAAHFSLPSKPGARHDAAPLSPAPVRVHLALLTVSLFFGANFVLTKELLATVPPAAWVAFRVLSASALLLPIAIWAGRGPVPLRLWPWLALASLLGVFGNQVLFTEGLARTTPSHSVVINACIPTWTLLLAAAFGQERLAARKLAAVGLALSGVACLLRVSRSRTRVHKARAQEGVLYVSPARPLTAAISPLRCDLRCPNHTGIVSVKHRPRTEDRELAGFQLLRRRRITQRLDRYFRRWLGGC